jgi:hypothetical protein
MALFRFDLQGEPFPINSPARVIMASRDGGTTEGSKTSNLLATFPTRCNDASVIRVAVDACRGGIFSVPDQIRSVTETWIQLVRIRIDYNTEEGLRRQLRHNWSEQFFETVTGAPFPIQLPKDVPVVISGKAGMTILPARISGDQVKRETIKVWNHWRGLRDRKAQDNYARTVKRHGIPLNAHSIQLSSRSNVLYPVFIAELENRSGRRLVVIDGVTDSVRPELSKVLTARLGSVMTLIHDLRCRVLQT